MFHKFLKDAREHSGLSQMDVAKKFKYSTAQFISNWERGISTPPPKVMYSLSKLYKIDENTMVSEFIKGKMDAKLRQIKSALKGSTTANKSKRKGSRGRPKGSAKVRGPG